MNQFQPPEFRQHLFIRGGHLQTIASIQPIRGVSLPTEQHVLALGDGDSVVLHDDRPQSWRPGEPSLMLLHGLCGCHGSPYMLRLAESFFRRGVRVFRLDMRGCGAGASLAKQLTHAGRSDDVIDALAEVARRTEAGKIGAIGVSLGGNQLLRAMGRLGAGVDPAGDWMRRIDRVAAVSPPVDLERCSQNMERWTLRPYNFYFIRLLLSRVPQQVRQRSDYQRAINQPRPKTLRQLDDRFTAPLSGFRDATEYYEHSSAMKVTHHNKVRTLVIAAADDPMVPVESFTDGKVAWSDSTQLLVSPQGGHVGFIDRARKSWMDEVLLRWFGGSEE